MGDIELVPSKSPASAKQKEIMFEAAKITFSKTPSDSEQDTAHKKDPTKYPYMCARGAYNVARNFTRLVKGQEPTEGQNIPSQGNANGSEYWNALKDLGYTQYTVGKNLTKVQMNDYINNGIPSSSGARQPWVEGDVIVYYSSDGEKFHSQTYTGGYSPGGWSCDRKFNWGVGFVYNRWKQNSYTLLYFKGPTVS